MTLLTPLLDLQQLDLTGDRLASRRASLPERERIRLAESAIVPLDEAHATLLGQRSALHSAEHALGDEVAAMAARARDVETTLYSGTVRHSKELSTLQSEMEALRERQAGLETRELELLEQIEGTEAEIAGNRSERDRLLAEVGASAEALSAAEQVIDAELEGLAEARRAEAARVPAAILVAYERLRTRDRLAGRAVAQLIDGGCSGCHMRMAVHEHNRMQAQPEDALLSCTHCGRILVRSVVRAST